MESAELKFDIIYLKNLAKQLAVKQEVQVGIFEENDKRSDGKSNVKIGFDHEFGNALEHLPMRSWLREPIMARGNQLAEAVENSLSQDLSLPNAYKALAKEAEHIVEGAFRSNGYGQWKQLSDRRVAERGESEPILVDTAEFKDAVKAKVVKL
jgi:hypothetical protein